jgi:hypothetical protein
MSEKKGFYVAQDAHVVQLFYPLDLTAGANSLVCRMAKYSHASILIGMAVPRAAGVVTITSCADMTPNTETAIAFSYYACKIGYQTALGDVLGARVDTAAATGIVPEAGSPTGIFYVAEFDADQLTSGHVGFRVKVAAPSAAMITCMFAILSGSRFAQDQSATVIA